MSVQRSSAIRRASHRAGALSCIYSHLDTGLADVDGDNLTHVGD